MHSQIKKILYHPTKARIAYDLLISFSCSLAIWLLFKIYSQPVQTIVIVVAYPLLFVTLNHLLGIYSRFRTASPLVKTILILLSVGLTLVIFYAIHIISLPLTISALFIFILTTLPRVLFNIYNQHKNYYYDVAVKTNLPILVVGGAGYIGTHLIEQLLKKNYKVRLLDKFLYGQEPISHLLKNKNLEVVNGDISDLYSLTFAMNNVQTVVHLAGIVGDPACALDDKLTRHLNIVSTRMLKESVKAFKIPKFIFASSCSVYGSSESIVNEESKTNPVSLYAETKIDSEEELLNTQLDYFHPTMLRFSTVFGHSSRMRFDLIANLFTAQAYHNGVLTVTGSHQWRPFIHVSDVANAVVKVIEADVDVVSRQIFNVGDDRLNLTIGDLAKLVANVVKKDKRGRPVKVLISDDAKDRRNYHVSFAKIRSILGYKAEMSIKDGVKEMHAHMMKKQYKFAFTNPIYNNFKMTEVLKKEFYSEDYQKNHFSTITLSP